MTENVISFFDCAPVPREEQLSVAPVAVEGTTITVKKTTRTAYKYMAKAARRLSRWITVTAENFYRVTARRVRVFIRNVVWTSGVQILRQSAILRF